MSEDDSFVILGSTPNSSVQLFISNDQFNSSQSLQSHQNTTKVPISLNMISIDSNLPSNGIQQSSMLNSQSNSETTAMKSNENNKQNSQMSNSKSNSFAASFILGDIDLNEVKENVCTEFPSLCTDEVDVDDIVKLRKLMVDCNTLKDNLMASNSFMLRCIETIENLKIELRNHKAEHAKDIKDCRVLIEDLQLENKMIKSALKTGNDLIVFEKKELEKNNEELKNIIMEKTSLIKQLNDDNDKLITLENIERTINMASICAESIPIAEHKKMMSEKDEKLSEILSDEILKFENVIQHYTEDINSLKENVQSTENKLKEANTNIDKLKCCCMERTELIESYEKEKQKLQEEITILKEQLGLYRSDFEEEHTLRKKMTNDRNQLLNDVANLQKRLEECVDIKSSMMKGGSDESDKGENSKKGKTNEEKGKMGAFKEDSIKYICPICDKECEILSEIEEHVQFCLNKNE